MNVRERDSNSRNGGNNFRKGHNALQEGPDKEREGVGEGEAAFTAWLKLKTRCQHTTLTPQSHKCWGKDSRQCDCITCTKGILSGGEVIVKFQ